MVTLTICRSEYDKIMKLTSDKPIKRLFIALVLCTDRAGAYTGWTPNGLLTVVGPWDSIKRVEEYLS
jgi:hypothetical protein